MEALEVGMVSPRLLAKKGKKCSESPLIATGTGRGRTPPLARRVRTSEQCALTHPDMLSRTFVGVRQDASHLHDVTESYCRDDGALVRLTSLC